MASAGSVVRPQASSEDSHGVFCRDRRVIGTEPRVRSRRNGQDHPRGLDGERARGVGQLVWRAGTAADADRAGAGPLSQWLHGGLTAAGFAAVLLETRHVKAALSVMIVKTDRKSLPGAGRGCAGH